MGTGQDAAGVNEAENNSEYAFAVQPSLRLVLTLSSCVRDVVTRVPSLTSLPLDPSPGDATGGACTPLAKMVLCNTAHILRKLLTAKNRGDLRDPGGSL